MLPKGLHKTGVGRSEGTPQDAVNLGNQNAESTAKMEPNWTETGYLSCISNRVADGANEVTLGEMHGTPDEYTPTVTEGDLLQHTTTSPGSRLCQAPFLGSSTLNKTEVWAVEKAELIARLAALEAKGLEEKHIAEREALLHVEKTTFAMFKEIGHQEEAGENFHTYSICRATDPATSLPRAILALLFSTALTFIQITALMMVVQESDHLACTSNADCLVGTWCSAGGSLLSPGSADGRNTQGMAGTCIDCYHAQVNPTWALANVESNSLASGLAYCNQTDFFPESCDYLIDNHHRATGSTAYMLTGVALLLCITTAWDADQMVLDKRVLILRLSTERSVCKTCVVLFLSWFFLLLRAWLLPPMLIAAIASLMISNELTVQNIILNGIAMAFLMEIDDYLWALVPPSFQDVSKKARSDIALRYALINADPIPHTIGELSRGELDHGDLRASSEGGRDYSARPQGYLRHLVHTFMDTMRVQPWLTSRVYATTMATCLVTQTLQTFKVMDAFDWDMFRFIPDPTRGPNPEDTPLKICSNLSVAHFMSIPISFLFAAVTELVKVGHLYYTRSIVLKKDWLGSCLFAFVMMIIQTCILVGVTFGVRDFASYLHFDSVTKTWWGAHEVYTK